MSLNYFAPVALTKALLPSMIERKSGAVVAVSSIQGKLSVGMRAAYSSSKHALNAFYTALRYELSALYSDHNIRVLTVNPGYVRTNLSKNALTGSGELHGKMDDTTAAGYSAEYVAHAILHSLAVGATDVDLIDIKTQFALWLQFLWPPLLNKFMVKKIRKEAAESKQQ